MKLIATGKEYVDQIAVERENYERLINRINTSQITIRGAVGRWSVKETIAYIQVCELYLADRINHVFSIQDLDKHLTDRQLAGVFFDYDHPEYGTPFRSNPNSVNWEIQKYNSIPLEDLVGLENLAYLSFIALLQLEEERLLTRVRFYKGFLVNILGLYSHHSITIEHWLAVHQ